MARPNMGPKLIRRRRPTRATRPYYISWTEGGRSREMSTATEDRAAAEQILADFVRVRGLQIGHYSKPIEIDISAGMLVPEGSVWEYPTAIGKIDILAPGEVIEIKQASMWKSGIGQVLAYQMMFPDRKPRLHLFGRRLSEAQQNACSTLCRRLGIVLTFDPHTRPKRPYKKRSATVTQRPDLGSDNLPLQASPDARSVAERQALSTD